MKKLLILSGKGGTGKTTTATAFIRFSNARAFCDCDVDAPNLHMLNGMKDADVTESDFMGSEKAYIDPEKCTGCGKCMTHCRFDSIRMVDGKCRVNETSCEGCGTCTYVCPHHASTMVPDVAGKRTLYRTDEKVFSTAQLKMGRGNSGKLVTQVKQDMMKNAPEECDLAIIDGSPGIGCPVIASISAVDMVLIVAEPSLSGISDLKRLMHTIRIFQTKAAVCINKYDASTESSDIIEAFCRNENIPFVGRIPYDRRVSESMNRGMSIADYDNPVRDALLDVFNNTARQMNYTYDSKEN